MVRAAQLDPSLYDEVEANPQVTNQALTVLILTGVASGVGTGLAAILSGEPSILGPLIALGTGIVASIVLWLTWAFITLIVGTRIFHGKATYGELLRTIGFSTTPRAVAVLKFVPVVGALIGLLAEIWALAAMVVALKQALDFSTAKAVLTGLVGFAVILVLLVLSGVFFGLVLAVPSIPG
jgi:hypothetical protein